MTTQLKVDTREIEAFAKEMKISVMDATIPLTRIDLYKRTKMAKEWNKAKADGGGTVQGQVWAPMKPQYTRKDGTEVPAWGGIAKVRGKGTVRGKKRPSGQRVKRTSVIGKDAGTLRSALFGFKDDGALSPPVIKRRTTLEIGGLALKSVKYAGTIFGYDNRNPLRWELPKDADKAKKIVMTWMEGIVKKAAAK